MIEIDFLPVGEETDTGDALLCHFTEPITGTDRVMLIDGGFLSTSADIAKHVRTYYGRGSIDLMVCTHPDEDHINGLFGVFDELDVGRLVLHRPSEHGYTGTSVAATKVNDLIRKAEQNGTTVTTNAFAGATFFNDAVMIGGPTLNFYLDQLSEQTRMTASLRNRFAKAIVAIRSRASDPGEVDFTDNGGDTPRNNSSIIVDVQVDGYRALFTGDAGVPALTRAHESLQAHGRALEYPDFFDVPHHGSRHNLDTETANLLLGPIGRVHGGEAVVSVGKNAVEHPRPSVANAIKRRGYEVVPTRGKAIHWSRGAPARPGWVTAQPLDWLDVE